MRTYSGEKPPHTQKSRKWEGTGRLDGMGGTADLVMVSIPFKREGTGRHARKDILDAKEKTQFRFPSNGKAQADLKTLFPVPMPKQWFRFPSNGKAHSDRPPFRPTRAVAPETPKPNTNCARLFFAENLSQKRHKPP